jgi:anti-anti-sigma factor
MRTIRRGKAIVLHMATEDFSNPPQVEAAFEEVVKLLNLRNVVVDMKSVTKLNSIGLSTITAGADFARAHNSRFSLASAHPEVRRMLERTGLASKDDNPTPQQVVIAEDVESALQSMSTEDSESADEGVPPRGSAG